MTRIVRQDTDTPTYSFHLPSGSIHGAIVCENKNFFAPADGIDWVEADLPLQKKPEEVQVHHIPLGTQNDKPRRTGAFTSCKSHVVFVTGRDDRTALVLLDARQPEPAPIEIALPMKAGQKATTPRIVETADGRSLAFVFHDHDKDAEVVDELTIVEVDPNHDGRANDTRILKTIPVGKSAVEGHFGHHDIDFDAEGRWAFLTNPGDGTLSAVALKDRTVRTTQSIGGQPTALTARGGRVVRD